MRKSFVVSGVMLIALASAGFVLADSEGVAERQRDARGEYIEVDIASTRYVLCVGEFQNACPKQFNPGAFRYCPPDGTNDQMNADWLCKRSGSGGDGARAVRLGNVAGNKCGYTTLEVTCFDRGRVYEDAGVVIEVD